VADELRIFERPTLERPVLIGAFRGWNDGGQAATLAAGYPARLWGARKFAEIDPELFVDFQATRPMVSLEEGQTRKIEWPENTFFRAPIPGANRDAVLLVGVEPNYRWRTFSELIADLARDLGVELVVTLGALLADVPHTRPSPVTGAATDPQLVDELGLQLSRYEGPTGIVGVLHDAYRAANLDSVSLWAPVPHYIASPPNPPASLAILERFGRLVHLDLDLSRVRRTASSWREQVDQVAAGDDDIQSYVTRLEARYDTDVDDTDDDWGDDLPTGDELADDFQQYLRDHRKE
jgi:proteasome assembly chaperone (PAC2) family protein